ncbi:MAG: L-lactate dehydrogenase [Alphaproteobacteria bacterium]|nr:L-lactate dehydrogenase [Alphaproteobacteria bacterium]
MRPVSVADYRLAARRRLPRVLFDYIDGGAYGERTLAANTEDLARVTLRQRVLRDVSRLDFGVELFGQTLSMPVILAPVGLSGLYARRGEIQGARAAARAGVPFSLSTMGVATAAEVAKAVAPPWYQLYMIKDRGFMSELMARVREAGCPVLYFTVDLPVPGSRYRDARHGMTDPRLAARLRQAMDGLAHPAWLWDVRVRGGAWTLGNLAGAGEGLTSLNQFWSWIGRQFDASITWKDIDWVRERWPGPLVLKGVLDVEDARAARACGVDGIVVSNHGGRQLDGAPSSISVLEEIAQAVGSDLSVLMDGGVRSGLDVLKALSLGARACLIGRAWVYALGARGEEGVTRVLDLFRQELRMAMSLTGCTSVREAGPNLLMRGKFESGFGTD